MLSLASLRRGRTGHQGSERSWVLRGRKGLMRVTAMERWDPSAFQLGVRTNSVRSLGGRIEAGAQRGPPRQDPWPSANRRDGVPVATAPRNAEGWALSISGCRGRVWGPIRDARKARSPTGTARPRRSVRTHPNRKLSRARCVLPAGQKQVVNPLPLEGDPGRIPHEVNDGKTRFGR